MSHGFDPRGLIKKGTIKKSIKDIPWEKTKYVVNWYGVDLPVGTEYKAFETQDAGYVILKTEVNNRKFWRE